MTTRDFVVLQYETHYRRFNDTISIMASTDSINWTAFAALEDYVANGRYAGNGTTATNPFLSTVNLSSVGANEPQFWFAFRFRADPSTVLAGTDIGCGYSWQLDDVALFDYDLTPAFDLSIGDFFYPPASFAQPVTQIGTDTMGFFADISNEGSSTVTNVVFKAEVLKGNTVIWSDELPIAAIDTSVTDSTFFIEDVFVPNNLDVAIDYRIRYSITSLDADDATPNDNVAEEGFVVTDNLYSKENGAAFGTRPGGDPSDWAVGNVYQTSSNWVEQYMATNAIYRVFVGDGDLQGSAITTALCAVRNDVVDANWNGFDDQGTYNNNESLTLRSVNITEFDAATDDETVTVNLIDFDNDQSGVLLEPGTRYILLNDFNGPLNTDILQTFEQTIEYFQISTIVYSGNWFLGGFEGRPNAVLRMEIDLFSTSDEVALPESSLSFFPNPASSTLNVDLNLDAPTLANVTIADINGRVIQIDEIENAQNQNRQYDVSSLPNGTYIVRLATKQGTKTKKFVVQH